MPPRPRVLAQLSAAGVAVATWTLLATSCTPLPALRFEEGEAGVADASVANDSGGAAPDAAADGPLLLCPGAPPPGVVCCGPLLQCQGPGCAAGCDVCERACGSSSTSTLCCADRIGRKPPACYSLSGGGQGGGGPGGGPGNESPYESCRERLE